MQYRLILFALLMSGTWLSAQNSGTISGSVVDVTTKQPLAGANIEVLGSELGASSDADGYFVIASAPEDIYNLRISFLGYQTYVETDVRVVRGKSTYVEAIELPPVSVDGEAVVVTSGFAEQNREAPVSNFTYSREQIIRAPGAAGDIFRAIEALPGVSTSGGEFSAFSVRGGTPKENIILVDNIPFSKLTHFDGGSTEEQDAQGGRFSVFAPGTIEEANFRGGGFSAEFGGKISSVLDLKIREGNFDSPTIDGRFDVLGWEVNYNGPAYFRKNTSLFLSARHQDFDRILEITGQENTGSPSFTDIILKTTTQVNPNHKLSLLAMYIPENFERDLSHVEASDDLAETDLGNFDEESGLLGLNWRALTGKSSYLETTVYGGFRDQLAEVGNAVARTNTPQSAADFNTRKIFDIDEKENDYGLRSVFAILPTAATTFSIGINPILKDYDYSLRQNGLDTVYVFDDTDFRPTEDQKYLIRRPQDIDNSFSDSRVFLNSWAEFSFRPLDRLTTTVGLRHEYNDFNEDQNFSPRASVNYQFSGATRLSLAGGVHYQIPDFAFLAADAANLDLKNERAIHSIVSLTHLLRNNLKFIGEVYYKQFDDLIVRPDRTSSRYANSGDGWASGFDLALIRRLTNKFYGQINYSYSQSIRNDNNGEGEYDSDFNQPHIFSILAGYEFNREWAIAGKWRFATGRPTDSFIVHENIFDNPAFLRYSKQIVGNNDERLPNFHTFNVRIDYRKQLGSIAIVSFLDVVNVYNNLNVNENRFLPLNGATEEEGFGILPTIGIKLEY